MKKGILFRRRVFIYFFFPNKLFFHVSFLYPRRFVFESRSYSLSRYTALRSCSGQPHCLVRPVDSSSSTSVREFNLNVVDDRLKTRRLLRIVYSSTVYLKKLNKWTSLFFLLTTVFQMVWRLRTGVVLPGSRSCVLWKEIIRSHKYFYYHPSSSRETIFFFSWRFSTILLVAHVMFNRVTSKWK